ncbi:MAG: nucleotidyltransferase domain-containing protein [Chloroflexi bacterium]|nr:nucleotidyltransferase domain-containing protein [Chloroflexota bacterium]
MRKIPVALQKEMVKRLVDEFNPETIYLFGSYAWGRPKDESDVDLLVIVKTSRQKPIQRAARAQRSLRGIKVPVDVLVKTHREFQRYVSVKASLEAQIMREGKLLYGRKALAGA